MTRGAHTAAAVSFAAALVALSGCFGTETGNPPFAPELGGGGYEPMGLSPDPTIEAARIVIAEAMLEDCEGGAHPLFREGALDAVRDTLVIGEPLEVPAGTFCALELRIEACDDAGTCRTVEPDGVAIDGTRRADGAAIEIRAPGPIVARLEGTFDVTEEAGGLLLAVDRTLLTAGLGLSTLPATDGIVRVDPATNADRLAALAEAVRSAITLRRDLDGDGMLDPEERMGDPLAAAPVPAM